jgi:hypothetical protein
MLTPCQNNGTCTNDNTSSVGYTCSCLSGFDGTECQNDYRLCQPSTCWNNGIFKKKNLIKLHIFVVGTCNVTSITTFNCTCAPGWEDVHCQTQIDYCGSITCLNNGVCQPVLLGFECLCLGDSYSGQYCEITSSKTKTLQAVAKSFAYIAIIAIVTVALFIVVMDILTYCFGIDLTNKERAALRQRKYIRKKRPGFFSRYIHIDASSLQASHRSVFIIETII